jgi:DNA-binding NarL/FixJ family response regulator
MTVTARARDGLEALDAIEASAPDVAVVDVRMPRLTGLEVSRRIARAGKDTAVVLYTAHGDAALLTEALDAGARGFVLKEAPLPELVRAVETVAAGRTYIDPVLGGYVSRPDRTLTQREREVLRLLSDGRSNEQIGRELFISAETVRTHISKATSKLGAATRTQAVANALRASLIA